MIISKIFLLIKIIRTKKWDRVRYIIMQFLQKLLICNIDKKNWKIYFSICFQKKQKTIKLFIFRVIRIFNIINNHIFSNIFERRKSYYIVQDAYFSIIIISLKKTQLESIIRVTNCQSVRIKIRVTEKKEWSLLLIRLK